MYKYPYGDSQQLNLDWILAKIKALESGGSGGAADLEAVANALVTLSFNLNTQYRRYDYCFLNGKLYRCLSDTSGVFDPSAWQEALIGDDLSVLTRWINAIDAAAVVDVKFDTSGTNGKLQQKYHDEYHDVVEVDYTPVQNSKRPLSSNAGYELNGAINNLTANDIANNSNVSGTKVKDALNTLDSALSQIGAVIMGSDVTNELRPAQVEEIRTATLTNGTWLLFGYVTFTEYFSQRASIYITNGSATLAQFNGTGDFAGPVSCFAAFAVNDNLNTKDVKLKIYQTSGATQYVNAGRLTCVKL